MEKIYIQKKGKAITGPYAVEDLRQHQLHPGDKVWYEGLDRWKSPQQVDFIRRHLSNRQKPGLFARIFG